MSTKEFLIKARALIENPENWIQGTSWLDANSKETYVGELACKFCSVGALAKFDKESHKYNSKYQQAKDLLDLSVEKYTEGYQDSIISFNDSHTHSEVLRVWDLTIEKAP